MCIKGYYTAALLTNLLLLAAILCVLNFSILSCFIGFMTYILYIKLKGQHIFLCTIFVKCLLCVSICVSVHSCIYYTAFSKVESYEFLCLNNISSVSHTLHFLTAFADLNQ